jgi:hypothetical protein
LRLLTTPNTPSTAHYTYYLAYGLNSKYEKPCIAVRQQQAGISRQILITSTKDSITKIARYHTSTDGGSTWSINWVLGQSWQLSDFTWSNSDSLTTGGGYFIAGYVDINGDSVSIRRGVIGSMGTTLYKRNSYTSTGTLPPVVAIYKVGSSKYSAFAYAGSGPNNVYYNQESLPAVGIEPAGTVPYKYALNQNYPNPFNPVTRITFDIPENVFVSLKVYDILGREVSNLVNENMQPGSYNITFDGANLISGVYFYKITAGKYSDVRKMMLIK